LVKRKLLNEYYNIQIYCECMGSITWILSLVRVREEKIAILTGFFTLIGL
jgi:hypothetical protein